MAPCTLRDTSPRTGFRSYFNHECLAGGRNCGGGRMYRLSWSSLPRRPPVGPNESLFRPVSMMLHSAGRHALDRRREPVITTPRNVVLYATVKKAIFDSPGLPFGSGPGYLAITAGRRSSRTSVARRIAGSYLPA